MDRSLSEVRVSYAEIWGKSIPGEEIADIKSQRQKGAWRVKQGFFIGGGAGVAHR